MNLLSLNEIEKTYRKDLEKRLEGAQNNIKNLNRMATECFEEIDRRAAEDIKTFSDLFHTLVLNEEAIIALLRQDLGPEVNTEELSQPLKKPIKLDPGPSFSIEIPLNDSEKTLIDLKKKIKDNRRHVV